MTTLHLKLFTWLVLLMMFVLSSCESAPAPNGDTLSQVWDAQDRATIAALTLQRVAGKATSQADATREYLFLSGQQTRLAHEARATQTTFAQRHTAASIAQSGNATATFIAAQFTATAHAQNIANTATAQSILVNATQQSASATATANAVIVEATRASASATATAQAMLVSATQVSASATSTADAANAQATRTSGDATATVLAAQVIAAQEKAEWDKRLEAGRAVASFVFGALVLVGLVVLVGFAALRFIDAGVLRARVFRDKTGTVFVIGERDERGRQAILVPGRSPGAVLSLTPPQQEPLQIEAGAVDAQVTQRDQAVSLMLAATSGAERRADEVLRELAEGNQVQFIEQPPTQLVAGDSAQLLDGQWKRLTDGKEE